jgi:Fe-S oxidoreductase
MDLCLSCKACKSECPSNVDMAKLKAEFLQQYYDANGVPFRSKLIANFTASARLGSAVPWLYNFIVTNPLTGTLVKKISGFATKRSMPKLSSNTLQHWYQKHQKQNPKGSTQLKRVYLFCDEFTNYNDASIGIKTVLLLEKLGYEVSIPQHEESGRTWLSKGLVRKAQAIINRNIEALAPLVSAEAPLIGIEPSAILTFRDEYPDLATDENMEAARTLATHVYTVDEFIANELAKGNISPELFTKETKRIKLHGHCQQKAISSVAATVKMLSAPENYTVETIPSGCCGMAGSFGYEKEHYEVSMQIGELVLFPTVRGLETETVIAAPGTSCRHQIKDGTGRIALHPVEILYDAVKKNMEII